MVRDVLHYLYIKGQSAIDTWMAQWNFYYSTDKKEWAWVTKGIKVPQFNLSPAFFGTPPPSPPAGNSLQRAAIILHELSHYYHNTSEREAWLLHNCFLYFWWRWWGNEDQDPNWKWWPIDKLQPRAWPKTRAEAKKVPDPRECLCQKFDKGAWLKMRNPPPSAGDHQ